MKRTIMRRGASILLANPVALAAFFCGFALLSSSPVRAQWIVNDPVHTAFGTLTEANTATNLFKDIQHYKAQLDHYQQQLASIQSMANMFTSLSLPGSQRLVKIDEDFGIAEKCNSSGLDFKSMLTSFLTINSKGDLVAQQRKLCSVVRLMENKKYNATVDFINETMPDIGDQYSRLFNKMTNGSRTNGNQEQWGNDVAAADAELKAKFEEFDKTIAQYDAYITSLNGQQRIISQIMLKGSNRTVGAVVQTATVAGALGVSPSDIIP